MNTELFHVVTWNNYGEPMMKRNAWFYTRPAAEEHAALIEKVMGAMVSTTIATDAECQRLGV